MSHRTVRVGTGRTRRVSFPQSVCACGPRAHQAGRNETVAYPAEELAPVRTIVRGLLDHVRAGEFIPTQDRNDCTYCDYGTVCRASSGASGNVDSPRAGWAEERAESLPVYTPMLTRRGQTTSNGEGA